MASHWVLAEAEAKKPPAVKTETEPVAYAAASAALGETDNDALEAADAP